MRANHVASGPLGEQTLGGDPLVGKVSESLGEQTSCQASKLIVFLTTERISCRADLQVSKPSKGLGQSMSL